MKLLYIHIYIFPKEADERTRSIPPRRIIIGAKSIHRDGHDKDRGEPRAKRETREPNHEQKPAARVANKLGEPGGQADDEGRAMGEPWEGGVREPP